MLMGLPLDRGMVYFNSKSLEQGLGQKQPGGTSEAIKVG